MKSWIMSLVLVAAVFLCYYQALDFGFIWDDQLYVVQNDAVHDWSRAVEAFTSPRTTWTANSQYNMAAWRPLRNISFLIDYSLFGLNPVGYHLHNIALHAIASVLLLFLLRRLGRLFLSLPSGEEQYLLSCCWIATLFWAWHPVQTEVVAWVKSRDDLLATPLFFSALLLALPRSRENIRPGFLALAGAILCYLGALLSKENVVVIAAILPVLLFGRALHIIGHAPADLAPGTPSAQPALSKALRPAFWISFIFALVTLGALATRDIVLGRTAQASYPGTPTETILTMASAFLRYVQLIVWPWPPNVQLADYDAYRLIRSWSDPLALTGLTILAALIALALAARRRAPLLSIGLAFFLIAMVPFSNIVPMMQIMAERFLYLPLAGCAIVVAGVMVEIRGKILRQIAWWAMWAVVMGLVLQTNMRLPVWKSELALFNANRLANPASWRPADLYVRALLRDGQTTSALTVANQNLKHWPNDPDIVRTAAIAHLLAGDEPGGVRLTSRAMQLQPDDPRASNTLHQWRLYKK